MRHATPFRFGEHLATNLADRDLDNRQGYFSVSENNPQNDLDDVLQFTARTSISLQNIDSTRFAGASNNLANMAEDANNNNQLDPGEDINGNGQLDSGLNGVGFNQPDWDDGVYDNVSESIAAEISYFLRNGILYRRVLLLRQPAYGGDQPTNTAGNPIVPAYQPGTALLVRLRFFRPTSIPSWAFRGSMAWIPWTTRGRWPTTPWDTAVTGSVTAT
ncbi:MAG: hypothetical protein CM1200mP2_20380 [Planctomycetaceae bacterium]|nr:MAG: hypothetical protein CM1200mP2_20380 [Planctomycetaceae bacterium]